jgi:small subunit ribosomal protein S1
MRDTLSELFKNSVEQQNVKVGSLLIGIVISLDREKAIVNIGLNSVGFIPIDEFKNSKGGLEITEGDVVEVALKSIDDGLGNVLLSYIDAKRIKLWKSLEVSMNSEEIVTEVVKGGLSVDIGLVKVFLPDRLVDTYNLRT